MQINSFKEQWTFVVIHKTNTTTQSFIIIFSVYIIKESVLYNVIPNIIETHIENHINK